MYLLLTAFTAGYLAIVFEHPLGVNKAASALLCGVLCWTALVLRGDHHAVEAQLAHSLGDASGILFFLLGAMVIVALIDAHDGFELITARVRTRSRRKLLALVALLAFALSAVLDNLTTSIVMMSLVRKLMTDEADRRQYGGMVIIASNAGGVWSPIGDVTTTMLWMGGQLTTAAVIKALFVPALVSVLVPALWIGLRLRGELPRAGAPGARIPAQGQDPGPFELPESAAAAGKSLAQLNLRALTGASVVSLTRDDVTQQNPSPREPLRANDRLELAGDPGQVASALRLLVLGETSKPTTAAERVAVFSVGLGVFLFVPVFKTLTHLPPFMGILFGLGVLWALTEVIHKSKNDENKGALSVAGALQRIDSQSVLFFLGILLAIGALESAGLLTALARALDRAIGQQDLITVAIGLVSSVVDNVPLVAAARGMYPLATYPTDHGFWHFLAYCAGMGGNILIIGSAAGVAVMGIQRISFGWYARFMALPALAGYVAGILAYLAMARR